MANPRWFLANLVYVHVSRDDTSDRFAILELAGPPGDTPPLHVHRTEDEAFYLLEGAMRLHIGDRTIDAKPGDSVLAPRDLPHTYIAGASGARWLITSSPGDFERFVVAASQPAAATELPPPHGPPSADEVEMLNRLATENGIEILGPPGTLPT
jgi:quercetin dioxygenase-like cupin family protein